MVAHPRAADGPARIRPFDVAQARPLNRPRPVQVEADAQGRPTAVYLAGQRYAVEAALESWRIDDEWWREWPVSRVYWRLALEDGWVVTVYRELAKNRWFRQSYG